MARRPLTLAEEPEIPLYQGDMDEDLRVVSRNGLAERITGGLSHPSKMPSVAWGISAFRCKVGSALGKVENSVCASCYAMRGRYGFANVQRKLEERYRGLFSPLWTPSMVFLLNWNCDRHFRWFDSGDVQSEPQLLNICAVARHTRHLLHWLPSREAAIVRACKDAIPENLIVRLSAPMVDGPPPKDWPTVSSVYSDQPREGSVPCPAHQQGNRCADCRACWTPQIHEIAYPLR